MWQRKVREAGGACARRTQLQDEWEQGPAVGFLNTCGHCMQLLGAPQKRRCLAAHLSSAGEEGALPGSGVPLCTTTGRSG